MSNEDSVFRFYLYAHEFNVYPLIKFYRLKKNHMTIPNEPDAKLSYMNRLVLVFHRKKSDLYLAQQLGNKTIFYSGKKKKKAILFLVLWPP